MGKKVANDNNKKTTEMITRGQVWLADLGKVQGSEQGGIRPVLIVQNNTGNKFSSVITICPLTSKNKKKHANACRIKRRLIPARGKHCTGRTNYVLNQADRYEYNTGKKVYDLSFMELKELILSSFSNNSLNLLTHKVSILRRYVDYCLQKNYVSHNENRLVMFDRDALSELVSQQATNNKYITKEKLREYQSQLANEQDVAILEALYCGIRGRTEQNATLEELINLQINEKNIEYKNNELILVKNNDESRKLIVLDETMELLLEAKYQYQYIANNGMSERGEPKKSIINPQGDYIFRTPGKNKVSLFGVSVINRRIRKIQEWCGNKYITIGNLYISGMINMAIEKLKEQGELTKKDYISICEIYDYTDDPGNSWFFLKEAVKEYI